MYTIMNSHPIMRLPVLRAATAHSYRLRLILLLVAVHCTVVKAQPSDTLTTFIASNPNAVEMHVVYEGSRLQLSADDDYLLLGLSLAHPALQMRFLMQKASIYIDPTGKKKRQYEIVLPSAFDVKDQLEGTLPEAPKEVSKDVRPDIIPLMNALRQQGATFVANGKKMHLGYQRFHVELDQRADLINYYVLLPKDVLMEAKGLSDTWSVGIFSINDKAGMPPPEEGMGEGMMPPPIEGDDQQEIMELMQGDIRSWYKFSIDDVNNANLNAGPRIDVDASAKADSIVMQVTTYDIETQLTMLMQGLTLQVMQADTLTLSFPSAQMVRHKVRRHPNEVKASLSGSHQPTGMGRDDINGVVRPDVQPLVAALNDTTATIGSGGVVRPSRNFSIDVNRETAVMVFRIAVPKQAVQLHGAGMVNITLLSEPSALGPRPEFKGNRLSEENAPRPGGLGEGLRKEDMGRRTINRDFTVRVSDNR